MALVPFYDTVYITCRKTSFYNNYLSYPRMRTSLPWRYISRPLVKPHQGEISFFELESETLHQRDALVLGSRCPKSISPMLDN